MSQTCFDARTAPDEHPQEHSAASPTAHILAEGDRTACNPVARRAALQERRAPLRAGLRLKREPRPSVCGEVAPAQAASLCSDAEGNQLTSPSQPHVRTLPTCCRLDPRLWNLVLAACNGAGRTRTPVAAQTLCGSRLFFPEKM